MQQTSIGVFRGGGGCRTMSAFFSLLRAWEERKSGEARRDDSVVKGPPPALVAFGSVRFGPSSCLPFVV